MPLVQAQERPASEQPPVQQEQAARPVQQEPGREPGQALLEPVQSVEQERRLAPRREQPPVEQEQAAESPASQPWAAEQGAPRPEHPRADSPENQDSSRGSRRRRQ
jgi:hypothetical protein